MTYPIMSKDTAGRLRLLGHPPIFVTLIAIACALVIRAGQMLQALAKRTRAGQMLQALAKRTRAWLP